MFLRPNYRTKDGKDHVVGGDGANGRRSSPRTLCYLGELNGPAQARWLKSVEVFNEQGEAQQLKLFLSHIEVPDDDPQVRASYRFGLGFIREPGSRPTSWWPFWAMPCG